MQLYFLRHGHAEPAYFDKDDADRQLTHGGIQRMEHAAQVLAALNITPQHIFSSPRIRARQTAEIVAAALNQEIEIRQEVNFGFDMGAVEHLTKDLNDDDAVVFVGHEPSMSSIVEDISGASVVMKKGGLARIDTTTRKPLRGHLVWLIAPKVFDALG